MSDRKARLDHEFNDKGQCRFFIIGGNGEQQHRSEWYKTKSNANRGFDDLAASIDEIREPKLEVIHGDVLPPPNTAA